MNLKDFIKRYTSQSHRGWSESMFEFDFDIDGGFTLPEGFQIYNSISNIPHFTIATNRDERAIISYQDDRYLYQYMMMLFTWMRQ